jgi:hypothetical protein
VSLRRFSPYAEAWILAGKNDRQGLIPVAIGPSNIQGCCTHNLYLYQDGKNAELLRYTFAMFGNEPACFRTPVAAWT